MNRLGITNERSRLSGQMLVAASLFAAALCGPAGAQPMGTASVDPTAHETTTVAHETTAVDLVARRLNESLSREMFASFNLFIYIDKAERGPFAQRMFVFEKTDDANLALLYDWPVSTGRESLERDSRGRLQSTITPVGYYELDPKRLFLEHVSSQWDEEMPYAMFFDWKPNGHETGLAIHGAAGDAGNELGTRASGGCVRLSEDNARTLFGLVRTEFHAPTPKMAYLDDRSNASSEGFLLHDAAGRLKLGDGYSVLVVIDDYVGDSQVSSLF